MKLSRDKKKKIVQEFYEYLTNKKDFESCRKYMSPTYKQHNPIVPDGPEGLRWFIDFIKVNTPESRCYIKRSFVDGDYVILHVHAPLPPNAKGIEEIVPPGTKADLAIIEIFRLENDKIAEHWDVIQPIPEKMAHSNGMF